MKKILSKLFSKYAVLWEKNQANWDLPLSGIDKFGITLYLYFKEYQDGIKLTNYDIPIADLVKNEIKYSQHILAGNSENSLYSIDAEKRKPFWNGHYYYLHDFVKIWKIVAERKPKSKVLELACGTGWMSHWLAQAEFNVTTTSLTEGEVQIAEDRWKSWPFGGNLRATTLDLTGSSLFKEEFDVVFIYEGLHHVPTQENALRIAYTALRKNGIILLKEPNYLHTFRSRRGAVLKHIREIGFSKRQLRKLLKSAGFSYIHQPYNKFHFLGWKEIWMVAIKEGD